MRMKLDLQTASNSVQRDHPAIAPTTANTTRTCLLKPRETTNRPLLEAAE